MVVFAFHSFTAERNRIPTTSAATMKTVPKTAAPITYPIVTSLHISEAYLCVNCDMIHDQRECPCCTSSSSLHLREVLNKRQPRRSSVVEVDPKGCEPPVKLVVDDPQRR